MQIALGRWSLLVVACSICGLTSMATHAAEPEVLFEDNFTTFNPDLGKQFEGQEVKDGALHLNVDALTWMPKLYETKRFGDADVTLRVRLSSATANAGGQVGLIFWADNLQDYYSLTILDSGMCGVQHYRRNEWRIPVMFRKVEGVKTAPGDWNELRIVTQGAVATAYVNGTKLASFAGRPPKDGGLIGMFSLCDQKPHTAEYSALKAVVPTDPPPVIAVAKTADAADIFFFQDPKTFDPGWGVPNDAFGMKDDAIFLYPGPNSRKWQLFFGDAAPAMTVSAQVRMAQAADKSFDGAGLAFWGKERLDLYLYILTSNGKISVVHHAGSNAETLLASDVPAAAKLNLHQWTPISVVATPQHASLYIGQTLVGEVDNKSPLKESQFGIMAQADAAAPRLAEFKDIVATQTKPRE